MGYMMETALDTLDTHICAMAVIAIANECNVNQFLNLRHGLPLELPLALKSWMPGALR